MSGTRTVQRAVLGAVVIGLGLLAGCRGARAEAPVVPLPGEPRLRVMTYNVNYGLAGDPAAVAAIREGAADVVFLQETTPAWEEALRPALVDTYPYMEFRDGPGAGGLAVLSRFPFDAGELLPPTHGWFPAWRVVVEAPLGPVQALLVHLHPPLDEEGGFVSAYFTTPRVREAEIRTFAEALDPRLPTLVAGDFNEGPSGRAIALLEERGFRTALPDFAPGAPTWRWQTSVGPVTATLDHVVHDARLAPVAARVLPAGRSDHFPVVVELVARPRRP